MPLDNENLVIEPRFPHAKFLMDLMKKKDAQDPADKEFKGAKLLNRWYNTRLSCDVIVFQKADGTITYGIEPAVHHIGMDLQTMGCADAWGIEQESNALHTLGELVTYRQLKQYMLTGMFLESSKRSGVMYIFRRLKPTVALNMRGKEVTIMCTLCMHPIGYYAGTWAGAMCPTDDVIAHLMLMRGDEPMFWRRANHHPAYRPEAGL